MKKKISFILALIMISSVFYSTSIYAGAAAAPNKISFGNSDIQTIFDVKNNKYGDITSTNLGGICAGTANNRLFCVKSNSGEKVGTLYYYNDIYNENFKDIEKKAPKRITFIDGLLGHANAMAVDDKYVYVTMFQKEGTEKNSIIRISREAITHLKDGDVVSKSRTTVKDSNNNEYVIYTTYEPKKTNGDPYTKSITAITTYKYKVWTVKVGELEEEHREDKFIINYPNGKEKLGYTIATLTDDGRFLVSTSKDDLFYVNNTVYTDVPDDKKSDITMQDIFYDPQYGLFIAMWMKESTQNYVLRVDIRGLKTKNKTENLELKPTDEISINKTKENLDEKTTRKITQFEIESIAFIKRNKKKESTSYRFVFSCNKLSGKKGNMDSIEELKDFAKKVTKL